MKTHWKYAAAMVSAVVLGACGGGGATPSFNYSKLDGAYTCKNVIDPTSKISFTAKFTAESLTTTFTSGAVGTVTVFKDIVGMGNGYPMYSMKRSDGVNADTFFFLTEGTLEFAYGPISGLPDMKFQVVSIGICTKTSGPSNAP